MPTSPRPPIGTPPGGDGAPAREKAGLARIPNNLLAIGSAAVLTIYGAGFQRTRAAADKFSEEADAHARPSSTPSASTTVAAAPPRRTPTSGTGAGSLAPAALATAPAAPTASTAPTAPSAPAAAIASEPNKPAAANITNDSPSAPSPAIVAAPVVAPAPVAAAPASAPTSAPPPPAPKAAPAPAPHEPERPRSQWHDGSYTGWGTSRHGDIEATVVITDGHIVSAQISRCLTRYSCSWIAHLQQQVVVRQSADVDFVSGATQSTNAFYYAVVEALNKSR